MTPPRVSIVIPCYHSEQYIQRCVDSILAQTFKDWEAIFIVDDYRADKTERIITRCAELGWSERLDYLVTDNRFILSVNKDKTSPAKARNKGVSLAVGEYITFLDADDWWYPEKLSKQVHFMDTHAACQWCWGYATMHQGKREYLLKQAWDNPKADEMIPFQTFMLRRSLVDEIIRKDGHLLNPELPQIDDYDLFLRLKQHPNYCFRTPLSHYWIHDQGLTSGTPQLKILALQIGINVRQFHLQNLPRLLRLYGEFRAREILRLYGEFRAREILRPYILPLKNRIEKAIKDRRVSLQIEPTTRCNLRCVKYSRGTDTPIVDITESTLLRILSMHPGTHTILLQGLGEPFMHPRFAEICAIAKRHCKYLVVITNGTITEYEAWDYIDHIIVSLDTMDQEIAKVTRGNNYDLEAVKALLCVLARDGKPTADVNFVRSEFNHNQQQGVEDFCKELGIPCHITPIQNWYNPEEPEWGEAHLAVWNDREMVGKHDKPFRDNCPYLKGRKFYYDASGTQHPCCIRMRYNQSKPTPRMCETCPE
jgi:teichuronic acid biosynthesis glycosyltransferase TuaG